MSVKEYLKHVRSILSLRQDAGLTLKFAKSSFFEITVSASGTHDPTGETGKRQQELQSSLQLTTPEKPNEIDALFESLHVYRYFLSSAAEVAAPLKVLTRKTKVFELNGAESDAFQKFKKPVMSPPILALL